MSLRALAEIDQFEAWYAHGIRSGWISPSYCETHNDTPLTDDEWEEMEDGYAICVSAVRLYGPKGDT